MTDALIQLLHRRESIITDHVWRDSDSVGHFDALRQVSEEISAWAVAHDGQIDGRLRHYLANASFAKALVHLTDQTGG